MQYDEDRELAMKCDLCLERLEADEEPACKKACCAHCIFLSDMKSFSEETDRRVSQQ